MRLYPRARGELARRSDRAHGAVGGENRDAHGIEGDDRAAGLRHTVSDGQDLESVGDRPRHDASAWWSCVAPSPEG